MARLSVVVPVYNVRSYLRACLDSLVEQRYEDFEVILVDDGSTDDSPAIAQEYVDRDPRFRLVSQPNAGLGAARNTGARHATGEFLTFVDSDDVLTARSFQLRMDALDQTGSDIATGNVHRLTSFSHQQSPFLAETFARTRLATHVTDFRPLVMDRTAWNKIWRKSFWDRHAFAFPTGVLYEDIPVTIPSHFLAKSVDVIAEPVYLWRIREGGELSITQQRATPRAIEDRVNACQGVSEWLARKGPRGGKRIYDESVVADDLKYFLAAMEGAGEDFHRHFLDRVNRYLDTCDDDIYEPLPAIDRLKWHLVRRRLLPELLEVQRFHREDIRDRPPVQVGKRWYGDYPFRTDERLKVPLHVYELRQELTIAAMLDAVGWDGDEARIDGWSWIRGIGAATEGAQRVRVQALRTGRATSRFRQLRRLRLITAGIDLATTPVHRPDVTALTRQPLADLQWTGFRATLPARRIRRAARRGDASFEIFVTVQAGDVKRRGSRFTTDVLRPVRGADRFEADGTLLRFAPIGRRALLQVIRRWGRANALSADGDRVEVHGELHGYGNAKPKVRALLGEDEVVEGELRREGETFVATFSAERLAAGWTPPHAAEEDEAEDGAIWELELVDGRDVRKVVLEEAAPAAAVRSGDAEIALHRRRSGDAALVARAPRAIVTAARFTAEGHLEVEGDLGLAPTPLELVLAARGHTEEHVFGVRELGDGRFAATLTPGAIGSLAGTLPLREGVWHVCARRVGDLEEAHLVPVLLGRALLRDLPPRCVVAHKGYALGATQGDRANLVVHRDLDDDERGPFHQQRLRQSIYVPGRSAPLRDAVVFTSFGGRQYSDNPRAIHEELVRRGLALEHYWSVQDGMCEVPPTATPVRVGSREHLEVLASARYVVSNDHFPSWFVRRDDQLCLQTWHGTPLKRLGLDVSAQRKAVRKFERRWDQHVRNWQHVLSPNAFTTPILRRAYGVEGEMLELGYPRNDVLAGEQRDARSRELRARLGLPEDARTILYAPTYRDQMVDQRGRHRLDLHLELDKLRGALGPETVVLFRKHHYVVDAVPVTEDGFVRDVSSYPDGTELLLAADVLVTDYSSMMFDFANTGRPILFFTYDLDTYADEIRGFYFDFAEAAPGPLLRTTDELADALRSLDDVRARYAERYAAFTARFCELDDGHAAERVVDRLFVQA